MQVGQRLRILRDERDISMRSLARRSGLSANALSMIERGLTSPSVSTLTKLAGALEVPITAFFRVEPSREQIVFRKGVDRTSETFPAGAMETLGGNAFAGRMEAFLLTLECGVSSGPHGLLHTGNELVFCLEGRVMYEIDTQVFLMDAGDSLIFNAKLNHRWRNVGDIPARIMVTVSAFEEGERPAEYHLASMKAVAGVPGVVATSAAPSAKKN